MKLKVRKNYLLLLVALLTIISTILIVVRQSSTSTPQLTPPVDKATSLTPHPTQTIGNTEAYTAIKKIADTKGGEAAWKYVIDTYGKDNSQQLTAHDFAHYVGQLLYEKKGLNGMTVCTTDFAFGCYHGLLDRAFRQDLSKLNEAQKACTQVGVARSGPYASCIHGIGHGIASYFKDKDLANALKTCDKLPEGAPQFCYDGVFMEFSRDALDMFYKAEDPLFPCDSVDAKYTFACGRNQPSVMMNRLNKSYEDVIKDCQKAKDMNLRTACFVSLGFQAVYLAKQDPQQIIAMCQTVSDKEFEYQCTSAAAGELIFQNMAGWQTDAPILCNTLEGNNQKFCLDHLKMIQQQYSR